MKAVLSLLFLSILIFCAWSGYKKGLVMGIFSLIAFVVSVYGANLLSQTYSGEVIDALRPFASGFVEVNVVNKTVRPAMGIDSANLSVKDYFAQSVFSSLDLTSFSVKRTALAKQLLCGAYYTDLATLFLEQKNFLSSHATLRLS